MINPLSPYDLMRQAPERRAECINALTDFVNKVLVSYLPELEANGSVNIYDNGDPNQFPYWKIYCQDVVERFMQAGWVVKMDVDYVDRFTFELPGAMINHVTNGNGGT